MNEPHDELSSLASSLQIASVVPAILMSGSDIHPALVAIFFAVLLFILMASRIDKVSKYSITIIFLFPLAISGLAIYMIKHANDSGAMKYVSNIALMVAFISYVILLAPCSSFQKRKLIASSLDSDKYIFMLSLYGFSLFAITIFTLSVSIAKNYNGGSADDIIGSIIVAAATWAAFIFMSIVSGKATIEKVIFFLETIERKFNNSFREGE
jgi:hypothetical protein